MGRTPVSSAKCRVSSESAGVPVDQPCRLLLPLMSCIGVTSIGSKVAPTTMNLPFGPKPSTNSDIAFELGAVARITLAPPSFCSGIYFTSPQHWKCLHLRLGPNKRRKKTHSNSIASRIPRARRKRQRLPSSLLIENASDQDLCSTQKSVPRRFRSRLATIHQRSSIASFMHGQGV